MASSWRKIVFAEIFMTVIYFCFLNKQIFLDLKVKTKSSSYINLLNSLEADRSAFCKNLLKHSCDGPAHIPWTKEQLLQNNIFAQKILEVRERVNIVFLV